MGKCKNCWEAVGIEAFSFSWLFHFEVCPTLKEVRYKQMGRVENQGKAQISQEAEHREKESRSTWKDERETDTA